MPRPDSKTPPIKIASEVLRTRFNSDRGVARLVFLVSPTCEVCLTGAQSAAQALLSLPVEPTFRLYIVWLPVLDTDSLKAAENIRQRLPTDSRMVHFWDCDLIVSVTYHCLLGLRQGRRHHRVAWDIFMLYRPEIMWGEMPPMPDFWMHQLFLDNVPKLEVNTLKHQLDQILRGDMSQ